MNIYKFVFSCSTCIKKKIRIKKLSLREDDKSKVFRVACEIVVPAAQLYIGAIFIQAL